MGEWSHEEEGGALEVNCHFVWGRIRAGEPRWRATRANVVNLYAFSLSCAKCVVATEKMLYEEAPPTIMVKSYISRIGGQVRSRAGEKNKPYRHKHFLALIRYKASLNGSFKSVSCTLNAAPHKQNSTFCMKLLGERRKKFHRGETFGHCFTCI
jgi:hypothetical protein